jgi:hypothetical protein
MVKTIWNPINKEKSPEEYEQRVGDVIEELICAPDFLASLFENLVDDRRLLEALTGLRVNRRTSEKPRWKGASGYEHQIDESFSTDDERVVVLVECKCWAKSIGIPEFSTFLVRLIDIASEKQNCIILGILVTTQGHQGRGGGREQDQDCIAKLQSHFGKNGYPIAIQILSD